jgi:hypothetical protein
MRDKRQREPVGIRIDRDLLHQAKIAAVVQGKTLGKWLEEAIEEKVERERENERHSQSGGGETPQARDGGDSPAA